MLERFKVPESLAIRVPPDTMRGVVESIFTTLGMSDDDAAKCAGRAGNSWNSPASARRQMGSR